MIFLKPKHQQGFGLLEVLVSLFLLSFGILGIAGMQLTALHNAQDAYWYSIATTQIQGMFERLRVNQTSAMREKEYEQWDALNQQLLPHAISSYICNNTICDIEINWQGYQPQQLSMSAAL